MTVFPVYTPIVAITAKLAEFLLLLRATHKSRGTFLYDTPSLCL